MFQHEHTVASASAMPTRVPPPGDVATEQAARSHLASPQWLTVAEKVAYAHRMGWVHFGPICPVCNPGRAS